VAALHQKQSQHGHEVANRRDHYLYYNGHGDLAATADASGNSTAAETYDPFGAPLASQPANTTEHLFTGRWNKQYDTTSDLVLMGARPYDPSLGRFLAVDPVDGGSLNNYDYAAQDPVNGYDLSGLVSDDWRRAGCGGCEGWANGPEDNAAIAEAKAGEGEAQEAIPEPQIRYKLDEHRALERSEHNFRGSGISYNDLEKGSRQVIGDLAKMGDVPKGMSVEIDVRIKGQTVTFRVFNLGGGHIDVNTAFIKK
jgi:RHS repeat-associated protein